MSDSPVRWSCSTCHVDLAAQQRTHGPCHSVTTWTCVATERSGNHDSYRKHASHCEYCSPDLELDIAAARQANTENRMVAVEEDEKGQHLHSHTPPSPTSRFTSHPTHARPFHLSLLCTEAPQWPWSEWSIDETALVLQTGLHLKEVDTRWARESLLALRLSMRQRHENMSPLSTHAMLCLTIHWLRRYPPISVLAHGTNHTRHYVIDTLRDVVHVLDRDIFRQLIRPVDKASPYSTRSTLPRVRLLVDTTFIPLSKTPFNPRLYHKKSPTKAALKFELGADLSHRIVSVSQVYPSPTDDRRILRESGLLNQVTDDSRILRDLGYQGKLGVITPARRKPKRVRELASLEDESTKRHELQTERAAIENINQRVKQFKIIDEVYRGEYEDVETMNSIVRVVCALTNLLLVEHPLRKGE